MTKIDDKIQARWDASETFRRAAFFVAGVVATLLVQYIL